MFSTSKILEFYSLQEIENLAEKYFLLPDDRKKEISMHKGGKAWRGSFLVGDELTRYGSLDISYIT
jgi:isopenicillin N synthase-like dioxygenase